jgi:3-methyladenine DNA glycosylase Mpg
VDGVKGEATSYLWYVRSSTCALSMHGQVHGVVNCFNYVADSDITAAALIEAINCLTTYRVSYSKAWRAKEHTLALFVGRLERSLRKGTEIVICHSTLQSRHQMRYQYLWSVATQ